MSKDEDYLMSRIMADPARRANYQAAYDAEAQRRAARDFATDAATVARNLRKDDAIKQRIVSRGLPFAVDAAELTEASSRELAARALKAFGIEAGENDAVALLDAHHAGRVFERARMGRSMDSSGNVWDGSDTAGDGFVARFRRDQK